MKICVFRSKKLFAGAALAVLLGGLLLMIWMHINTISPVSRFKEPIYQGNTGQKVVAITINVDWGEEFIPGMLAELKKANAPATFFVTGRWAEKNQELLQTMFKEGHSIQNHGYKHLHFASLASGQTAEEIKKAEEVIYQATGHRTSFFAPPYGEKNRQIMEGAQSINYDLVMWSVDTIDWQRPNPETIIKRVTNKVHNDAIILMHPTEPTAKALPQLLKQLQEEGYKMVPIEQIVVHQKGGDQAQ